MQLNIGLRSDEYLEAFWSSNCSCDKYGIMQSMSARRHALHYPVTLKDASICPTTVLTFSITVKDEYCVDGSSFQRIVELLIDGF